MSEILRQLRDVLVGVSVTNLSLPPLLLQSEAVLNKSQIDTGQSHCSIGLSLTMQLLTGDVVLIDCSSEYTHRYQLKTIKKGGLTDTLYHVTKIQLGVVEGREFSCFVVI